MPEKQPIESKQTNECIKVRSIDKVFSVAFILPHISVISVLAEVRFGSNRPRTSSPVDELAGRPGRMKTIDDSGKMLASCKQERVAAAERASTPKAST